MPTLYRKRLVPDECINLKDDTLVHLENNLIVTAWETFRPKAEFSHGISCYLIDKGYKISKFYRPDNSLAYIYCDIISTEYDSNTDTYIFTDLLADVIIENSGFVKVVDLEELGDALLDGILTKEQLADSLNKLNQLLNDIYSGAFKEYLTTLESFEK